MDYSSESSPWLEVLLLAVNGRGGALQCKQGMHARLSGHLMLPVGALKQGRQA